MNIEYVYLIPSNLLKHLKAHEVLSDLFQNINETCYNTMMAEIINNIMTSSKITYKHNKHFQITYEHKIEWMECFERTLNELCIDSDNTLNLGAKMKKILDDMVINNNMEKLYDKISNIIVKSYDKDLIIQQLNNYIDNFEITT